MSILKTRLAVVEVLPEESRLDEHFCTPLHVQG